MEVLIFFGTFFGLVFGGLAAIAAMFFAVGWISDRF